MTIVPYAISFPLVVGQLQGFSSFCVCGFCIFLDTVGQWRSDSKWVGERGGWDWERSTRQELNSRQLHPKCKYVGTLPTRLSALTQGISEWLLRYCCEVARMLKVVARQWLEFSAIVRKALKGRCIEWLWQVMSNVVVAYWLRSKES